MLKSSSLVKMKIFHKRHRPKEYEFSHKMLYVCLKLSATFSAIKTRFFSVQGFNFFSIFWKDYGFKKFSDPRLYITEILDKQAIDSGCIDSVYLLTIPKALGWGFNPISFWLCFDLQGALRIVLAEVNNTFKERHGYLCFNPKMKPITRLTAISHPKVLHVSPFCQVRGHYDFRFDINEANMKIDIDYFDEGERLISTAIHGEIIKFNDRNLAAYFLSLPFITFKVLFFIHFHALRLWFKKIPFRSTPKKPDIDIT
ncbi:MAG: DUF1365 family protein [Porticoccus sp.]|jgi:DUF1365 family protein